MKHIAIIFVLACCIGMPTQAKPFDKMKECIYTPRDKKIVEEKLKTFSPYSNLPINELIVKIGLSFIDAPYVAATLENGPDEKMVINLRELDCTTFAETVLALSRTVKSGKKDFKSYIAELEYLRYRDGIRDKYPSRLHYFSEWIINNQQKGIVDASPNMNGVKCNKTINYMSKFSDKYPVLKAHPEMIPTVAAQEKELTKKGYMFFPKTDIPNLYKNLMHGDIIALSSNIEGADVNHVGIIIKKGDEFYLLHAALKGKKVELSHDPITSFLKPDSKNDGILIARPVFQK